MLLLKNEYKTDLIDCIIFNEIRVSLSNDFVSLIDTDHSKSMSKVALWDLLDAKNIITVEDGLEVSLVKELILELVELFVMWVLLGEILLIKCDQHLEYFGFRVHRLLMQ